MLYIEPVLLRSLYDLLDVIFIRWYNTDFHWCDSSQPEVGVSAVHVKTDGPVSHSGERSDGLTGEETVRVLPSGGST